MTSDDVLAWMAMQPNRTRPVVARSHSAMLKAWLLLRKDRCFRDDVIGRHGLTHRLYLNPVDDDHAIGNAWSHVVRVLSLDMPKGCQPAPMPAQRGPSSVAKIQAEVKQVRKEVEDVE